MKNTLKKVGFGGGCHWCTEAVFQSLHGVCKVAQGFIAQRGEDPSFSEAVITTFNSTIIDLKTLIEVHLHTHKSTSAHSMRTKYRSAIYVYDEATYTLATQYLKELQTEFHQKIITQVYFFDAFKYSNEQFHNYYYTNPKKPFCETYISPKLKLLLSKFKAHVAIEKINSSHEL